MSFYIKSVNKKTNEIEMEYKENINEEIKVDETEKFKINKNEEKEKKFKINI